MNRVVTGYRIGAFAAKKNVAARQQTFTKQDFLKARFVFKTLTLVGLIVLLCLVYIWSRVQVVEYGYRINELKKQQTSLLNSNKLLKVELSLLKSPERLEKYALERLNMRVPGQEKIIKVD